MVLLWHCCENPFLEPLFLGVFLISGTFQFSKGLFIVKKRFFRFLNVLQSKKKWLFEQLFSERFFDKLVMVLLWNSFKTPFLDHLF